MKRLPVAAAVLAGSLALAAGAVSGLGPGDAVALRSSAPEEIQGSYAFDVTNRAKVVSYANTVFVGRVLATESSNAEPPATEFLVAVERVIKGSPPAQLRVRQTGYTGGARTVHLRDQPLLSVGQRYVMVVNQSDTGSAVVVAGPHSAKEVGPADEERLVEEYRAAIAADVRPDDPAGRL